MKSKEWMYFDIRDVLTRYNNPPRFAGKIFGKSDDFEKVYKSTIALLEGGGWIMPWNVEAILVTRNQGNCGFAYYEVGSALKIDVLNLFFVLNKFPYG
jgi:hypothetical protein